MSALFNVFSPKTGIAFYPGKARLLSCKHHYYDHILPLINPGQPGDIECTTQRINYTDPFTNQTMVITQQNKAYSVGCGEVLLVVGVFESRNIYKMLQNILASRVVVFFSSIIYFFSSKPSPYIFRNVKYPNQFLYMLWMIDFHVALCNKQTWTEQKFCFAQLNSLNLSPKCKHTPSYGISNVESSSSFVIFVTLGKFLVKQLSILLYFSSMYQ